MVLGIGAEGDACVAFVQAIPGLEPVDLTIGDSDSPTATGVAFGEYVDFVAVPGDGNLSVQITDTASPDLLLADASLDLGADGAFVVVLEQGLRRRRSDADRGAHRPLGHSDQRRHGWRSITR